MPKSKTQPKSKTKPKPKPKDDPLSLRDFAKKKLKITVWPKMQEIFSAVAPEDGTPGSRKILIRSCNGAGKTTALAAICNWYFLTHPDSIVLTTASSWMQVKRNLWGEIRRQAREANLFKGKRTIWTETMIKVTDKHFMLGISPNMPENAMGFHAPHILIAVDEATGVDREIMTALTGNLTSANAQIVLICNPIDKDSYPFEAEATGEWKVIEISAFDHPNVKEGNENIPGAVTREWVLDRILSWSLELGREMVEMGKSVYVGWLNKWFRKTPLVQTRILGEWSQFDSVGFIPLELISAYALPAKPFKFVIEPPAMQPKVRAMGVDIARGVGGDATVYAYFDVHENDADVQLDFKHYYDEDLMATADRIQREHETCRAAGIDLVIAIDDTGIGGGVSDKLKREKVPFFPVNFASTPRGFLKEKDLANARAEMYFLVAQELRDGKLWLIHHLKFHQELSSVRLEVSKTNGSYKMEDKTQTKQRLGCSPDYADAMALARYALQLKKYEKNLKFL